MNRSPGFNVPVFLAMAFAVLAALFAPAAHAQGTTPYTWKTVAMGGGGFVSGILYHPAVSGLAYARTDVGGAYRWDAANAKWVALNDDIGGLNNEFMRLGVLSLAVDPNDANRLYLACGQYTFPDSWNPAGILLASNDRGATWTRTTLSVKLGGNEDGRNAGERLQVDPNDGRILFLGTSKDGLWKSTDRGATWTKLTAFPASSCTLVQFDRTTGTSGNATQTLLVGVNSTSSTALYRSNDAGVTWNVVPGQPGGQMPLRADIAYSGGTRSLYLAYSNAIGPNGASAGAVWKYDVGGGTWTNVTPASGAWGFNGVSVDAQNPQHLLVSTLDRWAAGDEIYRSTDGGTTWTGLLLGKTRDHSSAPWAAASTPHWIGDVRINPFATGEAMFVTGYGLFRSTNADTANPTWVFHNQQLEETVGLMMVSPPSGAPLVSVIGDLDGFRHDDLDTPPAARHAPRQGSNASIALAGNAPLKLARTYHAGTRGAYSNDGGSTWTAFGSAISASANGGIIAISADGATLVWSQERTPPQRSTNNGTSWTACAGAPTSTSATHAPVADRVNANRFYLYDSSAGRVYWSNDAGANFTAGASVPTGAAPMRAVNGQEGHLWLPAWSSGLRRSTDGGASFSAVGSVQEAYAIGSGKAAPGEAYPALYLWGKVGGTVGFFRSTDTAATWTRINDDRHQYGYINWIEGDARTFGRVYLATSGRGFVYGDVDTSAALPALRSTTYAPFTIGAGGSWNPGVTVPAGVSFSATNLPAWATLDPLTGVISGVAPNLPGQTTVIALRATHTSGASTTGNVILVLASGGNTLRLAALSTRAVVGTGAEQLIPGVNIVGSGTLGVLERAGGPNLARYGVTGTLADPRMQLIPFPSSTILASNNDWFAGADGTAIEATALSVGASDYVRGSKDAALLAELSPGLFTVPVSDVGGGTGVALVEVYAANSTGARFVGISARARVGTGGDIMIAGAALDGTGAKRLLVRALGPKLGTYGLTGYLADPVIELYTIGGALLDTNDNWGAHPDAAEIATLSATLGLAALDAGSGDSVLLPQLASGAFTLQIKGKNGGTGVALVELYFVD